MIDWANNNTMKIVFIVFSVVILSVLFIIPRGEVTFMKKVPSVYSKVLINQDGESVIVSHIQKFASYEKSTKDYSIKDSIYGVEVYTADDAIDFDFKTEAQQQQFMDGLSDRIGDNPHINKQKSSDSGDVTGSAFAGALLGGLL